MDDDPKNSPESGNTSLPLALTRQQTEVFELLRGLSTEREKFHEWYRGAIQVLNSLSSDRIPQAAHSIRELCDKLCDPPVADRFWLWQVGKMPLLFQRLEPTRIIKLGKPFVNHLVFPAFSIAARLDFQKIPLQGLDWGYGRIEFRNVCDSIW